MILKPVTSEKAVKLIEIENTLIFRVERKARKSEIKKEFEETFKVNVEKIRTLIRKNEKYVYIKLDKKNPAIDVATKLGMI
ncbi:50S ribosomal protein L23 [Candidatus Pacearchaeota archaeon]|nr:50S ribosomal protein L23 [Candidatus Pacearchaeota archaeon]